jgi:hypothetical protein
MDTFSTYTHTNLYPDQSYIFMNGHIIYRQTTIIGEDDFNSKIQTCFIVYIPANSNSSVSAISNTFTTTHQQEYQHGNGNGNGNEQTSHKCRDDEADDENENKTCNDTETTSCNSSPSLNEELGLEPIHNHVVYRCIDTEPDDVNRYALNQKGVYYKVILEEDETHPSEHYFEPRPFNTLFRIEHYPLQIQLSEENIHKYPFIQEEVVRYTQSGDRELQFEDITKLYFEFNPHMYNRVVHKLFKPDHITFEECCMYDIHFDKRQNKNILVDAENSGMITIHHHGRIISFRYTNTIKQDRDTGDFGDVSEGNEPVLVLFEHHS